MRGHWFLSAWLVARTCWLLEDGTDTAGRTGAEAGTVDFVAWERGMDLTNIESIIHYNLTPSYNNTLAISDTDEAKLNCDNLIIIWSEQSTELAQKKFILLTLNHVIYISFII